MSVSIKFSKKIHAFNTVLMKGEVLGKVDQFYRKKEYQARGAPHYHVLLWISDAPVIGQDDPDKVLSWIQDLNLAYMHLRLEELFGDNEWFGARNILFVGDILQLQSVNGTPIFEKISQKS